MGRGPRLRRLAGFLMSSIRNVMDRAAFGFHILPVMSKVLNVTPKSVAIDLVLVAVVWFLFMLWFRPHVPSEEGSIINLVAAYTALPAAGTFWLCLQMFKVTLAHQRKLAKK